MRVLIAVLVLGLSIPAHAVNVRGRIDFRSPQGYLPMANITVQLCNVNLGCLSYRTGYDGMYYLNAPSGPHDVLVNGRVIYQINIPDQEYFDIPPLLGN